MWPILPILMVVGHLVLTVAFCFWFVYLLQDVINKRACYKAALLRMQEPNDTYQQQVVYNTETCYVLSLYLFIINIAEWVTVTSFVATFVYINVKYGLKCASQMSISNSFNHSTETNLTFSDCLTLSLKNSLLNSETHAFLINSGYNLILLSLTLIASLCNYLTARYARMSWIKSNRIPYFIVLVLVIMLVAQISTLFCFLILIVRLIHFVITAIAFAVGIHQYRRLRMVIQWIVVDLEISQTDHNSLIKFKRMNKQFKITFTVLWLGIVFTLISIFVNNFLIGTQLVLQLIFEPNKYHALCTLHSNYLPKYVFNVSILIINLFSSLGAIFAFSLYTIYGYVAMFVLLRRRIRGETGFRTHYHIKSRTPLVNKFYSQ